MLLSRLNKYQEATRSFHRDLLTDNKKIIQAHNQVPVKSVLNLKKARGSDPVRSKKQRYPPASASHDCRAVLESPAAK